MKGSVSYIKKLGLFKEIMLNNFKLGTNAVRQGFRNTRMLL